MSTKYTEEQKRYIALGVSLGTAIGCAVGAAFGNLAFGIGPGIAIGAAAGVGMAKRRAPKPSTDDAGTASDDGWSWIHPKPYPCRHVIPELAGKERVHSLIPTSIQ